MFRTIPSALTYLIVAFTTYLWLKKCLPRLLTINPKSVHLCLLNVDEHHCGDPSSWLAPSPRKIYLSTEEKNKVIRMYAQLDREIKTHGSCMIGVGYTNCQDIGFRAVELFKALEPELSQLQNLKPQVHSDIENFAQFVETFLWHFKEGIDGEYVSQNKALFFMLLDRLNTAQVT